MNSLIHAVRAYVRNREDKCEQEKQKRELDSIIEEIGSFNSFFSDFMNKSIELSRKEYYSELGFEEGDKVRFKESVKKPRHGTDGQKVKGKIGTLEEIDFDDNDGEVEFSEDKDNLTVSLSEIETVEKKNDPFKDLVVPELKTPKAYRTFCQEMLEGVKAFKKVDKKNMERAYMILDGKLRHAENEDEFKAGIDRHSQLTKQLEEYKKISPEHYARRMFLYNLDKKIKEIEAEKPDYKRIAEEVIKDLRRKNIRVKYSNSGELKKGSRVRIRRNSEFAGQNSGIGTMLGDFGSEGSDNKGKWAKVEFDSGYDNNYRKCDLESAGCVLPEQATKKDYEKFIGRLSKEKSKHARKINSAVKKAERRHMPEMRMAELVRKSLPQLKEYMPDNYAEFFRQRIPDYNIGELIKK